MRWEFDRYARVGDGPELDKHVVNVLKGRLAVHEIVENAAQ